MTSPPEGVVVAFKPKGITSHDVVDGVRRLLGTKKVGHAGTLDPMATGVLVLGVGRATRLLRYLSGLDKEYEGTAVLGVETDTLDAEGQVLRTAPVEVSRDRVEEAMRALTGEIEQVPPAFSAVKVGGQKLYKAARRGEVVEAPPRTVRVERFELTRFEPPEVDLRVVCSSGTYIRVLVADVGRALGCGAHLSRLIRTRVGPFGLDRAVMVNRIKKPLPLETAVAHLPSFALEHPDEARAAGNGSCLAPAAIEGPYALFGPDKRFIGIWRDTGAKSCPEMVLAPVPDAG
ncbi:MAG: tRNA pseudouridine(55) synthase TruB [Actinomycetota bacterium]